jgi:hypothetical protein
MTEKSDIVRNPPPPAVGDVFRGPAAGLKTRALYYVRAIVDHEEDDEYDHLYQIVFRYYSQRKGWRYVVESAFGIGMGLYVKVNKPRAPVTPAVRCVPNSGGDGDADGEREQGGCRGDGRHGRGR